MIIYAAQPNDFVPTLIKELRTYYKNDEEISIEFFKNNSFSQIYSFYQDKFFTLQEMLQSFTVYKGAKIDLKYFLANKRTEFISRILNIDKIQRNKNDFIFSIVSHPVERVYEMFYFLKSIIDSKTALKMGDDIINFFINDFNKITIKNFINIFIEVQGKFKNNDIAVCDNLFLQFKDIDSVDYIGLKEDIVGSIKKLNRKLGLNIEEKKFSKFLPKKQYPKYKEEEVTKILEEDIDIYNKIKENYFNNK